MNGVANDKFATPLFMRRKQTRINGNSYDSTLLILIIKGDILILGYINPQAIYLINRYCLTQNRIAAAANRKNQYIAVPKNTPPNIQIKILIHLTFSSPVDKLGNTYSIITTMNKPH